MIRRLLLLLFIILISFSGCSTYKALTNTYDDSGLLESESAQIFIKNNLNVFAYKKRGLGAAEDPIGNLNWKTKLPPGLYRLEVSYSEYAVGRSFIPISLNLTAEKGKSYWVSYDKSYGFLNNTWQAGIFESEPQGFYGLLEFWK